jgi:L-fuculose-phosphate aldolase
MSRERKYRRENVSFGRMLHHRGYVAATDGNLSVRIDEERILATPTAMSKGALRAVDMVIVDPAGRQVAGRRHVSSEISMHLLIYKLRPDVCGIVHAHPCTANRLCCGRHRAESAFGLRRGSTPRPCSLRTGELWFSAALCPKVPPMGVIAPPLFARLEKDERSPARQ